MKKNLVIIILIILALILISGGIFILVSRNNQVSNKNLRLETEGDIKSMIKTIYSTSNTTLPSLETMKIDMSDNNTVSSYTSLKDNSDVEMVIVSEPLMSSQAYSLVVIKLKNGANIDSIKNQIYENINMRKWICVSAEKLYITNYDNVIFYVMSDEESAKSIYNSFKDYVGNNNGKELEKSEDANYELPGEILVQ